MQIDHGAPFVVPPCIVYGDWVYTNLPTPQDETYGMVLLTGDSASTASLGGESNED